MPIIKEWQPYPQVRALIWKITESEDFFIESTGYKPSIKSDIKRIEHIVGRHLLLQLSPNTDIHTIYKNENGKPFLPDGPYFSISHSWPYVAAAISNESSVGIDVQVFTNNVLKVKDKFLSSEEQDILGGDAQKICIAWSAKESVFKWLGGRDVPFKSSLPLILINDKNININLLHKNVDKNIIVEYLINTDFVASCAFYYDNI